MRAFLGVLVVVVVSAPLSAITTILLHPFWSWIEASTGIESVGHSGPAEWCYAATFLLIVAGGLLLFVSTSRGKSKDTGSA